MCGIFGVTNAKNSSRITYLGLFALQHRGQESAGISTLDNEIIHTHKGSGLVSDVFKEEDLKKLEGNNSVGHVRYSTAGGNLIENIQPITARINGIPVSLSHNGNIVNSDLIRSKLESTGAILQTSADTELILHTMARCNKSNFIEKLLFSINELLGAFSFLLLTPTHLYAVVDACGYRPLSLGQLVSENANQSWVLSSETCAMDLVGAKFIRDIAPGEILSINLSTGETQSYFFELTSMQSTTKQYAKCIFEHVYFARPDSLIWNTLTNDVRFAMGEELARNTPIEADMVIAVPDSGVPMAMGYSRVSGIPYKIGLIRNHYVGRTFIEPTQMIRNFKVKLKLNPVRELIRGKKIIVVDDSIVRGTTSQKIIELLYEAGAQEVHMRIASPPVKYPCYYGIDTPKRKELLAQTIEIDEMNSFLSSKTLDFLSENQLLNILKKFQTSGSPKHKEKSDGWCTACFSGNYQDKIAQRKGCIEKLGV